MSTIREHITQAIVANLTTGRPSGVPAPSRARVEPFERSSLPAIVVFPEREECETLHGKFAPVVVRTLSYRIECRASADPADAALEPLLAWVTKALAGQSLGGYAHTVIEDSTDWDFSAGDYDHALAAVRISVQYQTLTGDQERNV